MYRSASSPNIRSLPRLSATVDYARPSLSWNPRGIFSKPTEKWRLQGARRKIKSTGSTGGHILVDVCVCMGPGRLEVVC